MLSHFEQYYCSENHYYRKLIFEFYSPFSLLLNPNLNRSDTKLKVYKHSVKITVPTQVFILTRKTVRL